MRQPEEEGREWEQQQEEQQRMEQQQDEIRMGRGDSDPYSPPSSSSSSLASLYGSGDGDYNDDALPAYGNVGIGGSRNAAYSHYTRANPYDPYNDGRYN